MRPAPRKSLGQHFLTDGAIIRRIADAAEIGPSDTVIEIGSGPGDLTAELAVRARRVFAIEIDRVLAARLRERFAGAENVNVIEADALGIDYEALTSTNPPTLGGGQAGARGFGWIAVGNLPYNVGSAIVRRLLELARPPERLVVMLQKEVAEGMLASPGEMSIQSIGVQVYATGRRVFDVAPGSFFPPPKVRSAVIRLDVRETPAVPRPEIPRFFEVVRGGFSAPRKQLRNTLAQGMGIAPARSEAAIRRAGLDPRLRPETLTIDDWLMLTRSLDAPHA